MSISGKLFVGTLGVLFAGAVAYTYMDALRDPPQKSQPATAPVARPAPPAESLTAKFARERDDHIARLKEAIKQKDKRYGALGSAQEFIAIGDPEFIKLYNQVKAIEDKETAVLLKKLEAEQRAEARKKGVTLGMTKDQVLASSWGRPQSINTTTTSYGTREQWVYGGRNYLYFENGILTTVQN